MNVDDPEDDELNLGAPTPRETPFSRKSTGKAFTIHKPAAVWWRGKLQDGKPWAVLLADGSTLCVAWWTCHGSSHSRALERGDDPLAVPPGWSPPQAWLVVDDAANLQFGL